MQPTRRCQHQLSYNPKMVHRVGLEPTYLVREPGLQPGGFAAHTNGGLKLASGGGFEPPFDPIELSWLHRSAHFDLCRTAFYQLN